MTDAARKLLTDALALSEKERLELATEILASVDGQPDPDWEPAWLEELDRRVERAQSGEPGSDWDDVQARIAARLRSPG